MSSVSTASPVSGQQVFDSVNQLGAGNVQCPRNLQNCSEGRAVLASLKEAYVFRMVTAFKCELFLRDVALLTQRDQHTGKGPLFNSSTIVATT